MFPVLMLLLSIIIISSTAITHSKNESSRQSCESFGFFLANDYSVYDPDIKCVDAKGVDHVLVSTLVEKK